MKFFFLGLIIGAALNLFILSPNSGMEIYPEWHGSIKNINQIETFPSKSNNNSINFPIKTNQNIYLLKSDGSIQATASINDYFTDMSGNGKYFIKYQKVGADIEFYNINGERFWKLKSKEYPYLSYNAKIILLLNGDQSKIRVIDNNSNEIGVKEISGRLCTAISFSSENDFCAFGFLDGSFYILNEKGEIINKGNAPSGKIIKGIDVSLNGLYAAVHYGDIKQDYLQIINILKNNHETVALKHSHPVKTALHVSNNGYTTIIDNDNILHVSDSGDIEYNITIPPKRYGFSTISYNNGFYSVSYTKSNGEARFILFREDGAILRIRDYPSESFIQGFMKGDLIFLRGSDNLYCYRIHRGSSL